MDYYELAPEVAGQMGENTLLDSSVHPPEVSKLHYEFDGWLGDDLLETFPCYIVSAALRADIEASVPPQFYEFDQLEVTKSELFMELHPKKELPRFFWLRVKGRAGLDDFGMTESSRLVVSDSAMNVLSAHNLSHCEVTKYQCNTA